MPCLWDPPPLCSCMCWLECADICALPCLQILYFASTGNWQVIVWGVIVACVPITAVLALLYMLIGKAVEARQNRRREVGCVTHIMLHEMLWFVCSCARKHAHDTHKYAHLQRHEGWTELTA